MRVKQDMPPQGGYSSIEWARKMPKTGFSGYATFGIVGAVSFGACIFNYFERKRRRLHALDMTDSRIALEPLLKAERDREFLRQLRVNRDEENDLMKDVPGWVTGTLYGEPVYYNQADRMHEVKPEDYYVHAKFTTKERRMNEKNYH